jgi:hypothetical protein
VTGMWPVLVGRCTFATAADRFVEHFTCSGLQRDWCGIFILEVVSLFGGAVERGARYKFTDSIV